MKEKEREIVTRELIRGFNDACIEANTKVTGGQSVMNPWPMIGGTAISTVDDKNIIYPNNSRPGEVLLLTKPLGTQVVVNTVEWLRQKNEKYESVVKNGITEDDIWEMNAKGLISMSRLNRKAAELMRKYKASAATDITGFGFKGHLLNLVKAQKSNVEFIIDSMPVIKHTDLINNNVNDFKLTVGLSPETSGGLLISINKDKANDFIKEMEDNDENAWLVGGVYENMKENTVSFRENLHIESI